MMGVMGRAFCIIYRVPYEVPNVDKLVVERYSTGKVDLFIKLGISEICIHVKQIYTCALSHPLIVNNLN